MIEKKLLVIFKKFFSKEKKFKNFINMNMNNTKGWDSIAHVNFLLKLEKEFKLKIKTNDFFKLDSIKKIIRYLKEKI